jgi:hypothetical protein
MPLVGRYASPGHLMVLQGFYDDSGSDAASSVYMLGGIISSVERWKRFSDEWNGALEKDPGIRYLKMSEANSLEGQFSGWPAALRDQKVYLLSEIVEKHALITVESYLYREKFDKYIKGKTPLRIFNDPYFLCFYHIVVAVANLHNSFQCDAAFIFDEHGILGADVAQWWDVAKNLIESPDSKYLTSPPAFADDRRSVPLQGADLFVWHARNRLVPNGDDSIRTRAIMKNFSRLQSKRLNWDEKTLMELSGNLIYLNEFYRNRSQNGRH